jgi:hypothetical protein
MTTRTLVITTVLIASTVTTFAQTPAPRVAVPRVSTPGADTSLLPPPPAPPVAGIMIPSPRRNAQPVNVKIEFTLTDQRAGGPPVKRTLSVIVADQHTGQIRSQSDILGIGGGLPLNVDTTPELLTDGKIRVGFSLQYDWALANDADARTPPRGTVMKTAMHDSVSLILESGKAMVAAQSADPVGDRQVTVEVKATILR